MTRITLTTELGGNQSGSTIEVTPGVAEQLTGGEYATVVGDQPQGESSDAAGDTSEPPRSGRGSGQDKWAVYAQSLGIEVPADADRDAIIALVGARPAAADD